MAKQKETGNLGGARRLDLVVSPDVRTHRQIAGIMMHERIIELSNKLLDANLPRHTNRNARAGAMDEHGRVFICSASRDNSGREISPEALSVHALGASGNGKVELIAVSGDAPFFPGASRDAMMKHASDEAVTATLSPSGYCRVERVNRLFFENFLEISDFGREGVSISHIKAAQNAYELTFAPYGNAYAVYGAAIIAANKEIFSSGLWADATGSHLLPISSAIAKLWYSESGNMCRFREGMKLIIATKSIKPEIPYADRQAFFELAHTLKETENLKQPLPVYIFRVGEDGLPSSAWKTDSHKWLPDPFMLENASFDAWREADFAKLGGKGRKEGGKP